MRDESQPPSATSIDEERPAGAVQLDTATRLKLARGIMERTCMETGAGFVLMMFVPGTDLVLRSFRGLDTSDEALAAAREIVTLLGNHAAELAKQQSTGVKPLHNE